MVSYEEYKEKIAQFDTKIMHARQAVLWSREKGIKNSRIRPEWVASALLVILFADMMRMVSNKNAKISVVTIILLSLIILAYIIYSLTIYIPNYKTRKLSEKTFEEKNIILESLITQRKSLFTEFVALNGGKIFRCISREQDLAIWLDKDMLVFSSLINGLIIESESIEDISYIATDSLLKEYNQKLGGYSITAYNSKQTKEIEYSYIFFLTGKTFVFTSDAYEHLKALLPDKELIHKLQKGN